MERYYKSIKLTNEDLNGFYFLEIQESSRKHLLKENKAKRNRYLMIEIILLFLCAGIENYFFIGSSAIEMIVWITEICIIAAFFLTCYLWVVNNKILLNQNLKEIEIQLIEKLEKETELETGLNNPGVLHLYYPIIGKDIHTGYQSRVYIDKETYDKLEKGNIVKIKVNINDKI